ncbi:hypothetical protein DIZ81_00800 [Legionella taurinensis]|uniref:Uncharacterized protein n=1 Tax=Legionella taurinensis TaxID=70611 RepID=A0A3A5L7R0_9GAMM|nr:MULTISPECIES: hypothetical protein [Legionella]MDX1836586.1 hypothetical protein [Legionella taurinensis]PUT42953.1 hypothetical protein DB744_00805 [Legionella taurinensis]PUT45508.1 hypothetical protein DB746_00805 [Legionella taurinensis]PUT46917.1 hypothetical protein DB743_03195 [Legionella taurinensis]PUT49275.1 hypothetical protein DB745_00805 [Legionella taurinensis]
MKRLALLAVSSFLAVLLTACGDNAEKKAEDNAATNVEQTTTTTPAPAPADQNNNQTTTTPTDNNAATDASKPE